MEGEGDEGAPEGQGEGGVAIEERSRRQKENDYSTPDERNTHGKRVRVNWRGCMDRDGRVNGGRTE